LGFYSYIIFCKNVTVQAIYTDSKSYRLPGWHLDNFITQAIDFLKNNENTFLELIFF